MDRRNVYERDRLEEADEKMYKTLLKGGCTEAEARAALSEAQRVRAAASGGSPPVEGPPAADQAPPPAPPPVSSRAPPPAPPAAPPRGASSGTRRTRSEASAGTGSMASVPTPGLPPGGWSQTVPAARPPPLPMDAWKFLGPRFVCAQGEGNPPAVYWTHFANDFRNWFRTLPTAQGLFERFNNPWPHGGMRRFIEEETDDLEVVARDGSQLPAGPAPPDSMIRLKAGSAVGLIGWPVNWLTALNPDRSSRVRRREGEGRSDRSSRPHGREHQGRGDHRGERQREAHTERGRRHERSRDRGRDRDRDRDRGRDERHAHRSQRLHDHGRSRTRYEERGRDREGQRWQPGWTKDARQWTRRAEQAGKGSWQPDLRGIPITPQDNPGGAASSSGMPAPPTGPVDIWAVPGMPSLEEQLAAARPDRAKAGPPKAKEPALLLGALAPPTEAVAPKAEPVESAAPVADKAPGAPPLAVLAKTAPAGPPPKKAPESKPPTVAAPSGSAVAQEPKAKSEGPPPAATAAVGLAENNETRAETKAVPPSEEVAKAAAEMPSASSAAAGKAPDRPKRTVRRACRRSLQARRLGPPRPLLLSQQQRGLEDPWRRG